jgi:polar amino acid transport system substrate-binding protein
MLMKQLIQNLKSGKMELLEVPVPALHSGNLLIKTHYSIISTGTESAKVSNARKGYIGKAKAKPEQFKQVVESAKKDGVISTYQKIMNRLNAPSPLGYSCSGEVIAVGNNINGFKVGDMVSCGGHAFHSEVNSVSKYLCVRIPFKVKIKHGAYTTIGAIAIQGVRQADLHIGESCVVIGLGLVGQLTIQILKAGGITVAGIDINEKMVELAKKTGADYCYERNVPCLESNIIEMSGGHGVDAVIIAAGTSSLDPVELAGKLCRKKGKVVIVGDVPTGFSRENYYKKELSLLMSCSYGPGRYDPEYEEQGVDYPIGYARWTENRNMQAFLKLVDDGKIKLDLLTTHVFKFEEAIQAYELIMNKTESYTGILLKYDTKKEILKKVKFNKHTIPKESEVNIGFIGAGSFAQKALLPNAKKYGNLIGVATSSGYSAQNIAVKYGFQFATGDYQEISSDDTINTVFIVTRHNLHAQQVLDCLRKNKNVFVEKPLCLTEVELDQILSEYNNRNVRLMVGFNRRFSSLVQKVIEILGKETRKAINFRINAGSIPTNSWIQDKKIGGGRIIGELCHFIDLAMHIAGAPITEVSAFAMDDVNYNLDTLTTNLKFANESIAAISYFANGGKTMKKEYLEIFSSNVSIVINDFKELKVYGDKKSKIKLPRQDKGHLIEVESFLKALENGEPEPIPFNETYISSLAIFKIIQCINTGQIQYINV